MERATAAVVDGAARFCAWALTPEGRPLLGVIALGVLLERAVPHDGASHGRLH